MKPLGLVKKGCAWDFIDIRAFKNSNDRHSTSGDRSARKTLRRIVRSLKRSEKQKSITQRLNEEMNE